MKTITLAIAVTAASALLVCNSAKAQISLGSAGSFAVLGASTVTSTGNTVLNGNLGVSPGTSITGSPTVNGTTYYGDAVAAQAQSDALTAYNALAAETPTESLTGDTLGNGVGGTVLTLAPGVYFFSSSAQLNGELVLSGDGTYIFQIGSTLTTASSSSIVLEDGAQASDVYWQVGSSATLGTGTSLDGTIIADQSITLTTGASMDGSALALTGAVTLDDNNISVASSAVPEPTTVVAGVLMLLPLGFGAARSLRKMRTSHQWR